MLRCLIWSLCWVPTLCYAELWTLQAVVDRALDVSRAIAESKTDLQIQNMSLFKAVSGVSPRLIVGGTDVYNQQEFKFGGAVLLPLHQTQGQLTIAQPISTLIASIANARAELLKRQASEKMLEQARIEVAFGAAQLYREIQKYENVYLLSLDRVAASKAGLMVAQANHELGRISDSDFFRVKVLSSQAQIGVTAAKAEFDICMSVLRDALNLKEEIELEKLPQAKEIHFNLELPDLTISSEIALKSNRTIQIVKLNQRAVGEGSVFSWLAWLPNVSAFVTMTKQFGTVSDLSPNQLMNAGLKLDWTLWDGGERLLDTRMVQLQNYKLKLQVVDAERKLALEVQKTQVALDAALETFDLQKTSVQEAELAYQQIHEKFQLGAVSISDFLSAESSNYSAVVDLTKAVADLDIKHMQWKKAMGESRPVSILNGVSP